MHGPLFPSYTVLRLIVRKGEYPFDLLQANR